MHVAFGREGAGGDFTEEARKATRHPCFKVGGLEELRELQGRVWAHFKRGKGDEVGEEEVLAAPMECDEPGGPSSGKLNIFIPWFLVKAEATTYRIHSQPWCSHVIFWVVTFESGDLGLLE